MTSLLAVPNVSEGRDPTRISELADAFGTGARLLDTHTDATHNRTVFTIAPTNATLAEPLVNGARKAIERIDIALHEGEHPRIGALDVCPVVWLEPDAEPRAREQALAAADAIAALDVPVFLYGALASAPERVERAFFRRGGPLVLAERMRRGDLSPDLGPAQAHPTAGAALVTARPPLAAFNLELRGVGVDEARTIAKAVRESTPGGLPGVRAIAIPLEGERTQLSTNVHDPIAVPLAAVTERVRALAQGAGGDAVAAEIVGLVPRAALDGFPDDVPLPGFDAVRGVIENRIASPAE